MRQWIRVWGRSLAIAASLGFTFNTSAAVRTWTGNSPTSGNWTIPANWDGGVSSPSNGDDLIFPAIAGRYLTTNNFSGFRARSITFVFNGDGYQLHGNSIVLSNGVAANQLFGSNAIFFDITLGANQQWASLTSSDLGVFGDVTNAGHTLTITNDGAMLLAGVISGAGGLTKWGNNTLTFAGVSANTYSGLTTVNEGILALDKTTGLNALAGHLVIGGTPNTNNITVELRSSSQIPNASDITIHTNGVLNLNGFNETVGDLFVQGARIITGSGTLTLAGDISVENYDDHFSSVFGNANLGTGTRVFTHSGLLADFAFYGPVSGSANILKLGEGSLLLDRSNSFTGTLTVDNGDVWVYDNHALGSTNGGTIVTNLGLLIVYDWMHLGLHIAAEPLTLARTNAQEAVLFAGSNEDFSWAGNITLVQSARILMGDDSSLTFYGAISGGAAGLRLEGDGTFVFAGSSANTYTGTTHILDGDLVLTKTNAIAVAGFLDMRGELINQLRPHQIADNAVVLVPTGSQWRLNGNNETVGGLIADLASDGGEIALGSGTLTVTNEGFSFSHFHGPITGTGGFTKRGAGPFELGGDNTYTGPTRVEQGSLSVQDDQPLSPVTVFPGAALDGIGTVGHLHAQSSSTVSPGAFSIPFTYPLTTSNVLMDAGSTLRIRLQNTSNSLLIARGTVTLNSPNLVLFFGAVPKVGDTFTIIQNDGADPVIGTFAGLPAGQFYGPGGVLMEIAYGNDVTLRVVSPGLTNLPPGIGLTVIGGNGNGVIDPNECDQLRITVFNTSTNPLPAFHATLETTFPGITVTQPDSDFPAIAAKSTGTNISLFQITTPPEFTCGTNLPFLLNIYTASNSAYKLPILLPTGSPRVPVAFNNSDAMAIPDGGTIQSPVNVNFAGHVASIEVSMFIEHPLASDLDVTLIAPDGTEVPLALDLGSGPNYGTNCANSGRTSFRDDAPTAIASGSAPFVGTFRPSGYLSVFRGAPESMIDGEWKLRVTDDTHFNLGTLRCWSLVLAPAACTDGGGACDRCPGLISANISNASPVSDGYPYGNGLPSNCFSNQPCNDVSEVPSRYNVHTFTNRSSQSVCVAVTMNEACGTNFQVLQASAYLGAFNPAAPCEGYIGSATHVDFFVQQGSFKVPGGAVFQIVVFALNTPYTCDSYSLFVDGPELCPVPLKISAVNPSEMRLDWPSYAVGYELQRQETLPANNWANVTNQPVMTGGRLVVTNDVATPTGFYRLKKD